MPATACEFESHPAHSFCNAFVFSYIQVYVTLEYIKKYINLHDMKNREKLHDPEALCMQGRLIQVVVRLF